MNHQSLFSRKNKKNISVLSAESAQRMVKVKKLVVHIVIYSLSRDNKKGPLLHQVKWMFPDYGTIQDICAEFDPKILGKNET